VLQEFDYVVVGAGSAGCVLANRLSSDPDVSVCLLEAGDEDRSFWIHLPIGYGKTMWDPAVNWKFQTDPDPHMNGRQVYWPRGKTLGGSSSINGLIYIRGQREDYDQWASLGNTGWSFDEVLPYFIRSECNQRGADAFHGDSGPLRVSDIGQSNALIDAFIEAAQQNGVPRNNDFNGARQEGAGYFQLNTWRGWRWSTAKGYLKPVRNRPNLTVLTRAHATGLVLQGRRACGVKLLQRGEARQIRARREVILSAGAIQSPQLLQLSGVGPADLLQAHGVPIVHHLPGVGANLQDHLQIRLIYECARPITTNDAMNSLVGRIGLGLNWLLFRRGALAVGINQGGCFMRALPEAQRPDIQFHVATLSADMAGGKVHPFSGFTLSVCQLRPHSRGDIRIRGTDPLQPPSIRPNYLSDPLDQRTAVAAVRAARAMADAPAMRDYVRREVKPGRQDADDATLLEFCRDNGATIFHPSGTCSMGQGPMAVLDARLRVHGLQGLRVVDCSAMPTLVSGNTNAPVVMMAEKAADMIREDARFPG
jgi:choline dehydrogenase